jgi:acyl-CoA thioester hydrolase
MPDVDSARLRLLEQPETFRFFAQDTLRFSDTDKVGHINNVAYAAYCETGRVAFNIANIQGVRPPSSAMMIASVTVDYRAETHFPGMIDIGTGVWAIGRSSFTLGQGLFKDGKCRATARGTLVLVDTAARRPMPIPDAMRALLTQWLLP